MTKILIAILGFAVAGAIFFVYTQPTYESAQDVQAEIEEFDRALDKSRELQEIKRSLLARYNTFSGQDLNKLNKLLPDHVDNVRLVLDLDSLASRYGMAVQNVLISNSVPESSEQQPATVIGAITAENQKFDSLTMQFATQGTYHNMVRFLEDLESSLRVVDIVSLTLEPFKGDVLDEEDLEAEPIYAYNITIRTYWLK